MDIESEVLDILKEQTAVKFTGRVNILIEPNKQFIGEILLLDGQLWSASYKKMTGVRAIEEIMFQEVKLINQVYIVEPEVINENSRNIQTDSLEVIDRLEKTIQVFSQAQNHRPPPNIHLKIKSEFFSGLPQALTGEEFDLLCTICDRSLVEDIYKESNLSEGEITLGLVSLRRKGALQVERVL